MRAETNLNKAKTVKKMEVVCTPLEVMKKIGEFVESDCDFCELQSPDLTLGIRAQRNLGHFSAVEIVEMTILDRDGNGKKLFNDVRDYLEEHPLVCLVIFAGPSSDLAQELADHGYDGEKDSARIYK